MYRYSEADRQIIAAARKRNKDKRAEKRLYALGLRAAGKSAEEVSAATGFHRAYITQLTAKYRAGGIEAISGNHYGGNRRNMSEEEEASLLAPFREKEEKGQVVEVSEIKASYERAVGHRIGGSQIYYVLRRHGWRKVMPRSKHPKKASEEVIETSKKLKKK
ncbi:helix-turn-helix domain-containing protein [Enterocloster clostridioformis]|uniref:helix-turn-helix domain-containing protein n=1 Tax=Enterocloster clostridioformis TaxID=1531 RepID=UPI00080CB3F9|nr:helix-turn-helix domain-containing protein [Enterocloster clostridioformis]ANU47083.1 helix-turn-helix domain-containing protein [Lachnoclostridium sp. YL32]NDO32665.1 helix-turn-helix domain-containing protein [Enterocloster clostridioformis]OXE62926.1 helix-turn-helix domain-containing protein [Enterocloster clostridioformis]QQQ98206.1 helix-turn-helix domain-containing protein [Enterocloster clostridioformis]